MKKLGLVFVLLIVIGLGLYGFLRDQNKVTPAGHVDQPPDTGLSTFTSDEYKFSFQYPSHWGNFEIIRTDASPEDREGACVGQGYQIDGHFSNTTEADFFLSASSDNYVVCGGRGVGLRDFTNFSLQNGLLEVVYGNKGLVKQAGQSTNTIKYPLLDTFQTTQPQAPGYIFKGVIYESPEDVTYANAVVHPSEESPLELLVLTVEKGTNEESQKVLKKTLSTFKYLK